MAPHLARSYHHLFPLDPFSETKNEFFDESTKETSHLYELESFQIV